MKLKKFVGNEAPIAGHILGFTNNSVYVSDSWEINNFDVEWDNDDH